MLSLLFVKNDPAHYHFNEIGDFMRQRETQFKSQKAIKKLSISRNPAHIHSRRRRKLGSLRPVMLEATDRHAPAPAAPPFLIPQPPPTSAADIFTASAGRPFEPADSDAPRSPAVTDTLVDRQPPAAGWGLPDPFNFDWPQW